MSEPAAKQRQMIDLDEFERRLSRSPSPNRNDDPLAELARLVGGGEDRFESMFQARPTRGRAPAPQQPSHEEPHHIPDWLVEESHQHAQPAHRTVDFAAIEAGLRGSLDPEFQNFADAEDRRWHDHRAPARHQPQRQQDHYAHDDFAHNDLTHHDLAHDPHAYEQHGQDDYAEDDAWLDAPVAAHAAPIDDEPRSRMPLYVTAAIIVAGMLGIGATFAMKRTPAAPSQIAYIKASTTPVKVAAVDGGTEADANDHASILDKAPQPAPTAAVSQTEQPVDVNAFGKPATQVAATAPATAVPVPAAPGADASSDVTLGDMVQPHKVKTISVRPDGSFADSAAPAPAPDAAPPANPAMPSMAASDGGAALTPAPAAPASEPSRVPPASDDLPWSAQPSDNAAAAPAPHSGHGHKPVQVARAETGADDTADAPAPASGGFSVQLAAPASEAEAHSALVRLTRTYGAELHGYRLKYRQAKVGAKTVYRVRVGGLSHATAISLCEKLRAKGAACFLAHG